MAQRTSTEGKRKAIQWTYSMDQILLDALLHQVVKGNRVNETFTNLVFDEIVQEVRTGTNNALIDKERVTNKIKTLKRSFSEAYDAFKGLSGFGWNPVTKLFEAEEEVCKELIEKNPSASSWKSKSVAQYDKAKELWGKDRATGEHATTAAKEKARRLSIGEEVTIEGIDNMVEENTVVSEGYDLLTHYNPNEAYVPREDMFATQRPSSGSNPTTQKVEGSSTKKRRREDAYKSKISEINTVMERVADVLANGNVIVEKSNSIMERSRSRIYSFEEIYAELDALDINEDLKYEALELLVNDQGCARVFFGMPMEARTRWLLKKVPSRDK